MGLSYVYDNNKIKVSDSLASCHLCPRNCGVNRMQGECGVCGVDDKIYLARAALHMWEEPCISGTAGSGAVFFSGCPMKCVFCQNHDIAAMKVGKEIDVNRLARIFLELQDKGANNINLVTPTHYVPQIVYALDMVKQNGALHIPVVYNCGGYENVDTLKMLDGYVDIYMPDMKYCDDLLAVKYSRAAGYFNMAKAALKEMVRQVGTPVFCNEQSRNSVDAEPDSMETDTDEEDMFVMKKGVIVRHLVLPGCKEDSKKIIKYIYDTYGDDVYMSIMSQYTPMKSLVESGKYPELSKKLDRDDYDEVVDYAIDIGVENAFIQEDDVAEESFIPEFDYEGV